MQAATLPPDPNPNIVWVDYLAPRYADVYDTNCPDQPGQKEFCRTYVTHPGCNTDTSTDKNGDANTYCYGGAVRNGRWVEYEPHVPAAFDQRRLVLRRYRGYVYTYDGPARYPLTQAGTQQCWANHTPERCDAFTEQQLSFTTYPVTDKGVKACHDDGGIYELVKKADGTIVREYLPSVERDGWTWNCRWLPPVTHTH